jgi:hypothetical protein
MKNELVRHLIVAINEATTVIPGAVGRCRSAAVGLNSRIPVGGWETLLTVIDGLAADGLRWALLTVPGGMPVWLLRVDTHAEAEMLAPSLPQAGMSMRKQEWQQNCGTESSDLICPHCNTRYEQKVKVTGRASLGHQFA